MGVLTYSVLMMDYSVLNNPSWSEGHIHWFCSEWVKAQPWGLYLILPVHCLVIYSFCARVLIPLWSTDICYIYLLAWSYQTCPYLRRCSATESSATNLPPYSCWEDHCMIRWCILYWMVNILITWSLYSFNNLSIRVTAKPSAAALE